MTTITVKTYMTDGTECGTMQIDLKNAAVLWGIREFKKFLKTVVNPYAANECEGIKAELAAGLLEIMQYWAETEINVIIPEKGLTAVKALLEGDYKKANALGIGNKDLKQFEKWESMLELTSLETLEAWKEWRKQKLEKVTKANQAEFENFVKQCEQIEEITEEPTPENLKGECTMKENTTNTAVQEVQKQATAGAELTAEQIEMLKFHGLKQNAESINFINDMGLESECFTAVKNLKSVANNGAKVLAVFKNYTISYSNSEPTEYKYFAYYVGYKKGSYYKMPESVMKSAACEIYFKVISNSGKSVTIQTFEKYNGTITENTYKNKKLNPGGHGLGMCCSDGRIYHDLNDTAGVTKEITVDCFNLKAVSRWCKDCSLYVMECKEVTEEAFEAWKADKGAATSNDNQQKRKEAQELDFTPVFYPVSEELARQHKEMISFDDYKQGKATAEYQAQVSEVFEMCRTSSDPEKSLYIADLYSKKLARWYDDFNRNGASCPSVFICGAGNFQTMKKEKQNARYDTLMRQYTAIQGMKSKIKHPHGYEIRRQTITAEEFENILYFETVINETENRLQLVFDGKPEEEERNILKKNGFRWSPRFKAWQRQLTENAVCAVWQVVKDFDKLEESEAEATAKEIESAKEEQKQKQHDMQGELVDLAEKLDSYYDRLYEGDASLTAFEKVACAAGDDFIKNNPDYTGLVANFRGDYISSDRETAAFAFALADMGKIPAIIPEEPEPETEETTEEPFDWETVEFEEIDGLPNPEVLDLTESEEATEPEQEEPAQPGTVELKMPDIIDMLECLDRAKMKCTSAFYRGALLITDRLLTNATGKKVYYDSIKKKHCFDGITAATQPTETQQGKPAETIPTQAENPTEKPPKPENKEFAEDDTKRFEVGKIYGTASICDSNCIFKFVVVKRSKYFVWIKDIHGDTTRRKIETRKYTDGNYLKQEKCYPLGQYSMAPTLYATDILQGGTEPEKVPERPTITHKINSDYVSERDYAAEYVPF